LINLDFGSIEFLESGFGAISYHKSMLRLNSSISFAKLKFVILLYYKKVGARGKKRSLAWYEAKTFDNLNRNILP